MWFRNLVVYRLSADSAPTFDALEARFARHACVPCGALDRETFGWVSPRGDDRLIHVSQGRILIALGIEQKLLPASVVNQVARERAAALERQQGYKLGRKQMRELREQVSDELLPRAFSRRRAVHAWLDPLRGWLVVDAAAMARAETVLELLGETLDGLTLQPPRTQLGAASAMTAWLADGEAPDGFSLDRDLELRASDEAGATVRYARHHLEGDEIGAHIAAGKRATRLGMTWRERLSFVLDDRMQLKRLTFLDVLKEEAERGDGEDEQFELDFTLMAGEVGGLLDDLMVALGGEVGR